MAGCFGRIDEEMKVIIEALECEIERTCDETYITTWERDRKISRETDGDEEPRKRKGSDMKWKQEQKSTNGVEREEDGLNVSDGDDKQDEDAKMEV